MLIVTVAATVEPVSLAEAKEHLRVTHDSDDDLIGGLITAAREAAEQITGRALAAATYRYASEDVVKADTRLPLWPVESVSTVTYKDADGATQTMSSGNYTLDGDRAVLTIVSLPSFIANLSVTFVVNPALIPETVKMGIKRRIEELYNGEAADLSERILHLSRVNLGL